MKVIITIAVFILASEIDAQYDTYSGYNNCGEIDKAYGSQVKSHDTNDDTRGCTKIYYKSAEFMLKDRRGGKIDKKAKGGLIHLFIIRETIGASSHENFSIEIVWDGENWESTNKSFKKFKPFLSEGKWNNVVSIWIDKELPGEFEVILTEEIASADNKTYKYTIIK